MISFTRWPARARTSPCRVLFIVVIAGVALAGCGDTEDKPEGSDAAEDMTIADDATLEEFCYALNGLSSIDGDTPEVIQERIDLLAETGTVDGGPDELNEAAIVLVDWARARGNQVTESDLDAASDAEEARDAPSPYDDPDRALEDFREENCDNAYLDDFSAEGQSPDEDVIDNVLWERNQFIESGECDRLAELYTSDSAVEGLAESCYSGLEQSYDLVGGGVTGPVTADLVVQTPDGQELSIDGAKMEDGTWKLTSY